MATPLRVRVPTHEIQRWYTRRTVLERVRFGLDGITLHPLIKRGGWDQRTFPVDAHPAYRLMEALHTSGFEPDACRDVLAAYYRDRGKTAAEAEAHTDHKLARYVARYQALADALRQDGYVAGMAKDEVGVAIGRDGAFIKVSGGNHRFALARILAVPTVVAEVRFVHQRWWEAHRQPGARGVRRRIAAALADAWPAR